MTSVAQADDTNSLANQDSIEVPARSRHVVLDAAFLSPGGHLVLQANGLDDGFRVNFYDAQMGNWLLPAPLMSQKEVAAELGKLTDGGFVRLEHMPMITLTNGSKVFNFIDLKSVCFRPYAAFLEIAKPNGVAIERAIYIRRATPETIYSANDTAHGAQSLVTTHSCKSPTGADPALTAAYEQEAPLFFSDQAGGFFALLSRYAIHFDAAGDSGFFKGQDNVILLSSGDTQKLKTTLAGADKSKAPQDAVADAEHLIDKTAHQQMQNTQ